MSDAGQRALRQGAAAYFGLCFLGIVAGTVHIVAYELWADPMQWSAVLLAFFIPFAIAMGIRRHERWARWLGFWLGLGLAAGALLSTPKYVGSAIEGQLTDPVEMLGRFLVFPIAGMVAAFASWRLRSRRAREAMKPRSPPDRE